MDVRRNNPALNLMLQDWKFGRNIGTVDELVLPNSNEKRILKITSDTFGGKYELIASQIASDYGVGPKIYGLTSYNVDPEKYEFKQLRYIMMEYIDGQEFCNCSFEQAKKHLIGALECYRCLLKIGIDHNDTHGGNFMVTDDRVYIIDFEMTNIRTVSSQDYQLEKINKCLKCLVYSSILSEQEQKRLFDIGNQWIKTTFFR